MNPAMICCSTLSKAGDLSGRVLPRDLYLWVTDSRGGRLGPQKSVWVWWPLSLALLSWSSRLLLRKGLKSWKNIVGSKWSQNSAKCVDVLLPPPKKCKMCSFSWLWKGPSTLYSANSNSKGIIYCHYFLLPQSHPKIKRSFRLQILFTQSVFLQLSNQCLTR